MKKFRNKNTGTVITRKEGVVEVGYYELFDLVVEHPDWEEVKEDAYEILAFILKGSSVETGVRHRNVWGGFPEDNTAEEAWTSKDNVFAEEALLKNYSYSIYSVKRLCDGEVFTLGDKVDSGTISEFVCYNYSLSYLDIRTPFKYNLQNTVKQLLFTKEDGVQIFEGDSFAYTSGWTEPKVVKATSKHLNYKLPMDKLSSTKEVAEEWILKNKPCLSLNDLLSVWGSVEGGDSILFKRFEALVGKKLKK